MLAPGLNYGLLKTKGMSKANTIISIAGSYIGIKEKTGNSGFQNALFEVKMKQIGFYKGAPWCAFFTKLVLSEAYAGNPALKAIVNSYCTGGAQDTLKRMTANGTFAVGSVPKPGAVVIWQLGSGSSGHAGIVEEVDLANNVMTTIEGNTNADGGREGNVVARKFRTVNRAFRADGLNVKGYIYPKEA